MPLPFIPLAILGASFFAGTRLASDTTEAQVVVNTIPAAVPQNTFSDNVKNGALLAGTALALVLIAPKITGGNK